MSNNCSGSHNHYNPNEPRDDRGRWTSGADLSWAEQRLMMRDRSPTGLVRTLLLMTWTMLRGQTFETSDPNLIARVTRVLKVWNNASSLYDSTFASCFLGPDISLSTVAHLRAAARVMEAATAQHVAADAEHLVKAVQTITPARWPAAFDEMETRTGKFILAAWGGNMPKAPDGHFQLASDFDSKPVPFLDDQGRPVIGASGVPAMIPERVKPGYFVDRGLMASTFLNNNDLIPDEMIDAIFYSIRLSLDLPRFRQRHPWDLQRFENTKGVIDELVDSATIVLGLYGAAAGMSEDMLLNIQSLYAKIYSKYPENTEMDKTYTSFPKRNVDNTHIGYALYRSGRIGPSRK